MRQFHTPRGTRRHRITRERALKLVLRAAKRYDRPAGTTVCARWITDGSIDITAPACLPARLRSPPPVSPPRPPFATRETSLLFKHPIALSLHVPSFPFNPLPSAVKFPPRPSLLSHSPPSSSPSPHAYCAPNNPTNQQPHAQTPRHTGASTEGAQTKRATHRNPRPRRSARIPARARAVPQTGNVIPPRRSSFNHRGRHNTTTSQGSERGLETCVTTLRSSV